MGNIWQIWAKLGKIWAKLGQIWAKVIKIWANQNLAASKTLDLLLLYVR